MSLKSKAMLGQLSDMDLRLLQVFKAVVDCGGFSAAELELNIGISTISRHIKDLETRLGLVLCQRGRAGFAVTEQGRNVYEETRRLLTAVDGFRSSIDDIHARMGGQLHIALFEKTTGNPKAFIDQVISQFIQKAPSVLLNLHVRPINEIERGVMDHSYHLGIIPAHRPSRSLQYDYLFDERMQLYCGKHHPLFKSQDIRLGWDDIQAYPLAGLAYHSPNMEMSHQARLVRRANAFDQEGVAAFILSGQFVGFLPTHYAKSFEQEGLMRALNPQLFNYRAQFFSIVRRSPKLSQAVSLFRQCLISIHQTVGP